MSFPRVLLKTAALAALSSPLHAAVFCVATGTELQTALGNAAGNNVDDQIRITSGVKQRPSINGTFVWSYASPVTQDLHISGGWNGNCSSQWRNPRSTVLNGSATASILSLWIQGNATSTVNVENIAFQYGMTQDFGLGAALHVYASDNAVPAVVIDRVVATLNNQTGFPGSAVMIRQDGLAAGYYTVRNSLIEGNLTRGLDIEVQMGAVAFVNNNTITANTAVNGISPIVTLQGQGLVWLANNIIAGNDSEEDVWVLSGTGSIFRNNHIGVLTGAPGSNTGMTTGDPLLAIDGDGWWRPRSGSPARDSGQNAPAGGIGTADVADGSRVQGVRVDRGAIETDGNLIFDNDFERLD